MGVAWDVALPIGSVHDFTSNVSAAGFDVQFQYFLTSHISLGAGTDWQTFTDERERSTRQIENGALTTTAYNSVWGGDIRGTAHYYFLDEGPVLPFVGANIGIGWTTLQSSAADLAVYDNQTSVLLGGELGAVVQPGRHAPMFLVGARYTALPAVEFIDVTDVQSITFQLGLMLR